MATISLRISSDEEKLLQTYLAAHNLNISSFIRQVVFDKNWRWLSTRWKAYFAGS